ncbi:MAG: tetratricopeptide repeat protein, partial [Armatimonadota bacterium]
NPANWEQAQLQYPPLAKAFPEVYPKLLVNNKDAFYTLMGAYSRHINFAWFESFDKHIPYDFTVDDLKFDSSFYIGAMLLDIGKPGEALQRLRFLLKQPTNDFCAPALWLSAQCYRKMGNKDAAVALYQRLMAEFGWSGLADDAQMALKEIGGDGSEMAAAAAYLKTKYDMDVSNLDCYVGSQIIVFAPYTVSAKMRQYNMPNIWENAAGLMSDWTGVTLAGKPVLCVGDGGATNGLMIPIATSGIADPPQWSLGLEPLAACYVGAATQGKLGAVERPFSAGLARFASASLQYDLVTETRDAIGSAAAVALPQEEVIRARESSLAALEEYVRAQKKLKDVTPEVACGMLFSLLDMKGFSKSKLVDREPFRDLFPSLKKDDFGQGVEALTSILDECLGGGVADTLLKWNLVQDEQVTQR